MNNVTLVGRLTKDVELKGSKNGDTVIANFTLAVNRGGKDQGADFISCVAFNKTADLMEQYVGKGSQIGIQGRIQTGSYEDKDGNKRYTTDVIVDRLHFLDTKKKESEPEKPEPKGYSRSKR